uniref:Uncharacterized protein n=1 Tax=Cannabis sativa TaxID=3483 RepID=A0A803QED5_CANSA
MKGSALPISNYDKYRTDFPKGDAWPLLTRLAKNSLISAIPSLKTRDSPHPRSLLIGESSQTTAITSNAHATYSHASHTPSVPLHNVHNLPMAGTNITTATNAYNTTGVSLQNEVASKFISSPNRTIPMLVSHVATTSMYSLPAATTGASTKSQTSDVFSDLSGVFTPFAVMNNDPSVFATYPPAINTLHSNQTGQLHFPIPAKTYHLSQSIVASGAE